MVIGELIPPPSVAAMEEGSPLSIILLELHSMVLQRRSRASLDMVVDFVDCYARRLFAEQESQFSTAGYPWAAEHRRQHEAFCRRLRVLRVHLIVNTDAKLLAEMVQESLVDWWLRHDSGADRWCAAHRECLPATN